MHTPMLRVQVLFLPQSRSNRQLLSVVLCRVLLA
jgi:hypothetical protein